MVAALAAAGLEEKWRIRRAAAIVAGVLLCSCLLRAARQARQTKGVVLRNNCGAFIFVNMCSLCCQVLLGWHARTLVVALLFILAVEMKSVEKCEGFRWFFRCLPLSRAARFWLVRSTEKRVNSVIKWNHL